MQGRGGKLSGTDFRALAAHLAAARRLANSAGPSALLIDFDHDLLGSADRARLGAVIAATATPERHTILRQTPGARHTIASWAERIIPPLTRLLATPFSE